MRSSAFQPSTVVMALAALVAAPAFAQVIINPTGGTGSNDGIRVSVGGTGQLQVLRNGTGQLYSPSNTVAATTVNIMDNGVYLAVGNTVVGPQNFAMGLSAGVTAQEWTAISNTLTPQGNGGTATTVLRGTVGGKNYDLTVTYQYTYPNDFVTVTHSLVVPAGNTSTIRLYHVMDAYLGGDDYGPSFFSLGPPALVGGYRPASNIVEAWRARGGLAWTGYFAGYYGCLFDSIDCPTGQINSVYSAGTFTNYVEATTVDNSFGIMWNFGTAAGTYVSSNDLTFFSFQPQLSKKFGTTVITVPATTTLTFTIDNVPGALPQTGLNFTDTLPTGLTIANSTVTNTCGGSVTTAAGGAIGAGSTSVRLSGGGFASGGTRCTITVNVTSTTAGAYVNGPANISGVAVLENQVSDQTLSVVMGAPIVRLDAVGTINAGNVSAYRVSGSCQDTNGVVTVRVGSLMTTTPCSSNLFSTTLSVTTLSDGTGITVSASQTNGAGTGTDSGSTSKDTTLPAIPGFTSPAGGAFVNTSNPTINGTGEVGTTVRVYSGSTEICTAVVSASGTWSCVATTTTDGTYTLTARATDPAGNTGSTSPGRTITVDTMPPAAPVITNPAAAATVAPNPSLSGTSEALATVLVFEGATQLCSTPADATGQWSCPSTLGIGAHTVFARQIDRANNSGPNSVNRAFTIANVPTVLLDTPSAINATNATSFPVAGNCTTAAGVVTVRVSTVTTTTTCTAGRFSTTVNASSLSDGAAISLSASQTNATGTGTDTRSTVKDTLAPASPSISTPAEMSFINTTTPTFTGTGEPGSTVRVTRSGVELCNTVVPPSGMWACTSTGLLPGVVAVTARATDSADNTSGVSPVRTFTIDVTAPVAPIISTPTTGASVAPNPMLTGTAEPGATVSVFEGSALVCSVTASGAGAWSCSTVLGTGQHTVVARQIDQAGNTSPDSPPRPFTVDGLPNVLLNTPVDINAANAERYVVSGICTSNAGDVTVSVGLRTVQVPCAGGMFSATIDVRGLADSSMVTVRASQTTAAGTGADTRVVRKDATPPAGPVIEDPKMGATTTSNTPPISGTAEAGSTVTVYVNGNAVGTTVANSMGQWTFTPLTPLADGTYVVTADATDTAGNQGPRGAGVAFTIDSTAPSAPNIATPLADSTLDDDRPLAVTGFAEPNSTVTVYVDGVEVGTAMSDSAGRFSVPVDPLALGDGPHTVTADARDAAGNRGPKATDVRFSLRTVDQRFAGQGLIGCTGAGGPALAWLLLAVLARRRRS
ncbi:MAG: Ig-like domain-containing protein [Myxococcaceae bacterium]